MCFCVTVLKKVNRETVHRSLQKRASREEIEVIFMCLCVTLLKKVNSTQRFSLQKRPTRKEIEMIFLCLCITLLKKVNSTQRFSFAKEGKMRRNWNDIFVFYSFEKGK